MELCVDLPVEVAEDVEEVSRRDPDFFGKAIQYAMARRAIFDELRGTLPVTAPISDPSHGTRSTP